MTDKNLSRPPSGSTSTFFQRLIYALAAACAGLLAFFALRSAPKGEDIHEANTGIDWFSVTSRDLNIAAVFLTARDIGVRRALDSLKLLASHDSGLYGQGHGLTHALGRYAIAQHNNDLSIIEQCTELFEAGCYHGVLEGYLAVQKTVTRELVASICAPVERANASRIRALECSHGLGHGLLERLGYQLQATLDVCNYLAAEDARAECHDGVFMQNVSHGMDKAMIAVGDDALSAHHHTTDAEMAGSNKSGFRRDDLAFPCDSIAAEYQVSCWSYQPLAVIRLTNVDFQKTLVTCDRASGAGAVACYRGFGKQSTGWFSDRVSDITKHCSSATEPHVGDCFAGVVEAFIDATWAPDRALALCKEVPNGAKADCYGEIGARMRLIRPDTTTAKADCRLADAAFVAQCERRAAGQQTTGSGKN